MERTTLMEKTARAELIQALVTDKYSGFIDADTSMLEGASDERLEAFRAASDAARNAANERTKLETDNRNANARITVLSAQLKDAEAPMTDEEFIRRAPASIKKTLEVLAAQEAELKASLIEGLKDRGADGEDDLKKMSIPELKRLAKYARLEVRDYSGRGMPRDAEAVADDTLDALANPPNPYEAGLKALREQTKH